MFSFFKKKKQEAPRASPGADQELRKAVNDFRADFSDETLVRSMDLLDRVNRLRSVQWSFFESLVGLTDEISDRIVDEYESFQSFNSIEVHTFCVAIVATGLGVSDLPEHEMGEILDIYVGMNAETIARQVKSLDEVRLKGDMKRVCGEYIPLIARAATEPTPRIVHGHDSALKLVANVDRLAGVERDEVQQGVVAVKFKVAAMEAIRIVRQLTSDAT